MNKLILSLFIATLFSIQLIAQPQARNTPNAPITDLEAFIQLFEVQNTGNLHIHS